MNDIDTDRSEMQGRAERAMQMAKKIIDDEWLAAGVTQEELDREEQLMQVFSRLLSSGRSETDIMAEWEHKTPEEILREYSASIPALHNA